MSMSRINHGNFVGKSIVPLKCIIRKMVTDIKGPFSITGYNKDKYIQLFTENDTKFMYGYSMSNKSGAEKNLK